MPRYTLETQIEALKLYEQEQNLSRIARMEHMPSRKTLHDWKTEGVPVELTGGLGWDEYVQQKEEQIARDVRERAIIRYEQDTIDFLDRAKDDVRALFDQLRDRLLAGAGEAKFGDIEKLLMMFMRLDNQNADRLMWQQTMIRRMLEIIVHRLRNHPNLIALIKSDFIALQETGEKEIGMIPNRDRHRLPAEVVEDVDAHDVPHVVDAEDAEYEIMTNDEH